MTWLISNIGTITVALVLIAVISWVILGMVKNKKAGKSSCGCGCEHCAMQGACHNASAEKRKSDT